MTRFAFPLLLVAALPALGQEPPPPPSSPARPVLKALPIGGDEDVPQEQTQAPTAPQPAPDENLPPPENVPAPSPLDAKPTGDDALRLQIFLDEANFGPGIIDGKPGRFTELAVQSWNEVNGHPIDDWVAVNTAARKAVTTPLATALVPEIATKWVDPHQPTKVSLQAKKKRMSYGSLGEFMAERYHCDEEYLLLLNGAKKIYNLKLRDTIIVPNIRPFCIEKLTGARHEADPSLSQRHVVVDTRINQARIFEAAPAALVVAEPDAAAPDTDAAPVTRPNRGLVASFPITPGQPKFIKLGIWELRNMVELPHWRYDKKLLDHGKRSSDSETLNIPPGPNNPVGVIWNGLSRPGIGMHGTPTPQTIGRARSHGCIRLANWDAVRLPNLIRPGTTVEIR
jgi:lipoprotein-anchoring transpeptidase ErfK/SrfK